MPAKPEALLNFRASDICRPLLRASVRHRLWLWQLMLLRCRLCQVAASALHDSKCPNFQFIRTLFQHDGGKGRGRVSNQSGEEPALCNVSFKIQPRHGPVSMFGLRLDRRVPAHCYDCLDGGTPSLLLPLGWKPTETNLLQKTAAVPQEQRPSHSFLHMRIGRPLHKP